MRVAVLFGGRSGEHEVSLQSAASVIAALNKEKYEVIPVGITKAGSWLAGVEPLQLAEDGRRGEGPAAGEAGETRKTGVPGGHGAPGESGGARTPVTILADPVRKGLFCLDRLDGGPAEQLREELREQFQEGIDVVFPVLHGTYGEDGTIQGLFELAGVPYVGAGVLASSLGMDKVLMKTVFAQAGLPQAGFWSCLRKDWEKDPEAILAAIEKRFGSPCFVKPANLGSSVGISKAHDRGELAAALALAARYDRKIIVEEFIDARELEVSVLGNDEPVASVPGEIIPLREFYDYEAKYVDGNSELVIPAKVPPEVTAVLQDYAVRAFRALDCAGLARVDFFLTRAGGRVLVNEINTIPGFTRFSMYPKLWEAGGLSYPQLLDRLIELALERHREKTKTAYWR